MARSFTIAYLISGSILLAGDAISQGGSWCGVLGTLFPVAGILGTVWSPIKKFFSFVFLPQNPS